jgi:thioredoxin reductase (NADPH)
MPEMPIVPIIGGGPAGMSCALWLKNYGLKPIIIERAAALGGMARASPYPNDGLLGRPGATARENAAEFARHIEQAGVETWLGAHPQRVRHDGAFELDVAFAAQRSAQSLSCRAIVIATGTEFRGAEWLDQVANAPRLAAAGRVHLGPSYVGEPGVDLGSHIAVIGGGDNAFDVSRILAEKGVAVTMVMRSQEPHARPQLVDALRPHEAPGKAKVLAGKTVARLDEAGDRIRVRLDDRSELEVDHIVLLLGYRPSTHQAWLSALALAQDTNGYLIVDGNMETSCRGVFAIGDIGNPANPNVATAIASGTVAARGIQRRLSTR